MVKRIVKVGFRWCWLGDGGAVLLGNVIKGFHGDVVLLGNGIPGFHGGPVLLGNLIEVVFGAWLRMVVLC